MNAPERKSRATRAYENLREASGKIEFLAEYELKRIARAINPAVEEYCQVMVVNHHHWKDDNSLCGTDTLSRGSSHEIYKFRTRLLFMREEVRAGESGKIANDTRCVFEFKNALGLSVWLDCESGLPWNTRDFCPSCRNHRKYLSNARLMEVEAAERDALAKARAVLMEIEREKCISIVWQEDTSWKSDDAGYQRVDELREYRRPNSRAKFDDGKILAVKFHPTNPIKYPKHVPNHSVIHESEVAA